jgi:uncharacterized protein (TIGR00369 family)
MNAKELQEMIDASPFGKFSGYEVVKACPEGKKLVMTMPLRPEFERLPGSGQVHGGPIAALIDSAGCYALIMILESAVPTISFSTEYLRPAMNTHLTATATVRKLGRSIGVVDIEITSDDEKLVAIGRGVYSTVVR